MSIFADLSLHHLKGKSAERPDDIWEERPVSPSEFFEHFLREPLFPLQQRFVNTMLGTDPLVWDTRYNEGLALWGKGAGKDVMAAKLMTYCVYWLLCLKNPHSYFGLGVSGKIDLVNVARNARLARDVFFDDFTHFLRMTVNPKTGRNWFIEKGLNLQRDIKNREVTFTKRITAYSLDSETSTAEGMSVLMAVMDEVGDFEVHRAKALYDSLKMTARSRFPKHMKLLLLSYKYHDHDLMMRRMKEAQGEPRTYADGPRASWEVNPNLAKEQFRDDYVSDPDKAQRMYECTGASAEDRYFTYRERLVEVLTASPSGNPVVDDLCSVKSLRDLRFKDWFRPNANSYFIHIDLAKGQQNAAGLAMGHFDKELAVNFSEQYITSVTEQTGVKPETLRQQQGKKTGGVVVDLVLQLKAPAGREILFDDIVGFIRRLKQNGWPIRVVTFDFWQSTGLIQDVRGLDIEARELSVDKSPDAYEALKALIYPGVFVCYAHPVLLRELEELIVTPAGKIDHPMLSVRRSLEEGGLPRGSKDVADAVAGCAYLCVKHGKSSFQFWVAGAEPPQERPDLIKKMRDMYRFESEEKVRYGEKPKSWYRRFPW